MAHPDTRHNSSTVAATAFYQASFGHFYHSDIRLEATALSELYLTYVCGLECIQWGHCQHETNNSNQIILKVHKSQIDRVCRWCKVYQLLSFNTDTEWKEHYRAEHSRMDGHPNCNCFHIKRKIIDLLALKPALQPLLYCKECIHKWFESNNTYQTIRIK